MNKPQKNILYKRYLQGQEEVQEQKEISQKIGIETEKIVVKKVSTTAKIIEIFEEVFFKVIKAVFYVALCILASIGSTVLINGELREFFFELVRNTFM